MANQLYASITSCSGLRSITVSDSHNSATSSATIICETCSLDVGSEVSIDLGYSSNHDVVFTGYVKNIQRSQSPTLYEITCANKMIRAVDYFMVSSNPEQPFSRSNITAQALIRDVMEEAGLTNYAGSSTGFTFATKGTPVEVNLTSAYDFCKFIADLLAWHIYADNTGKVHFVNRPPFPDGGESSVATLDDSNLIAVSYGRSDRDLRNRVVVYGREGVYAEASEASPYLPAGFYKSVVIAAPTVIDDQGMAQSTADYNLEKLNRLTIGGSATIIGDSTILCRDCVTVNKSDIGMTGIFYVYGCEHDWSQEGFKTNLDLRQ